MSIFSCEPVDVLFLHGMFGGPGDWANARNSLSGCRTHAPELRVFDTSHGAHAIDSIVQAATDYIRESGIKRMVLVGNSLGGHIAIRLALLQPEAVAALVLTGSSGLFERGLTRHVPRRPTREWLRHKISEVFFDPGPISERLIDEVAMVVHDRGSSRQLLRLAQIAKRDHLGLLLPMIRCPALLVWGEDDRITPLTTAREFHRLLAQSEMRIIPRCGHAPMLERPREFNETLVEFLRRVGQLSSDVPSITRRTEQKQSAAHAGQDQNVMGEVCKAAAA